MSVTIKSLTGSVACSARGERAAAGQWRGMQGQRGTAADGDKLLSP